MQLNFDEINKNFDSFYSILVNKLLSYLRSKEKELYVDKLKQIYEISNNKLSFGEEGKTLYKLLLNEGSLQNEIFKKISDDPITQDDFEILLYSFRFVLNTQINKNKLFYNNILKKATNNFIKNNFIPGSFPFMNEYIRSYNDLLEKLPKKLDIGYYICKDCGFLYEVEPCTYPMKTNTCPNNHTIGGTEHVCYKKDIRVFLDKKSNEDFKKYWDDLYPRCRWHNYKDWQPSFIHKTLEEFKTDYIEQYLVKRQKGIISDFRYNDFENNIQVRNLTNIAYRLLNFILYSYLLGAFILNNLSIEEARNFLVENLFPHTLFGVIKNGWKSLDKSLKEIGINNAQTFINIIFDKVIELMNKLDSVDTQEKYDNFEKEINSYINEIISNKEKIKECNIEYHRLNNDLLNVNPQSIKEIIKGDFEPSTYDKNVYPDIEYYSVSNIVNINTFIEKFKSAEINIKTYALINIFINKDSELTKDARNMKSLANINNLVNLLLNIYSFKISREDGKKKILSEELDNIIEKFNEMNPVNIEDEDAMIKKYINPFIESWDKIKAKSIQYKCRVLRKLEKGENPLEMKIDNKLCYFLVDDGDKEGGMFLASAYEHFIKWQNLFINEIITKNGIKGILNSYVSQLEQEIDIEEATKEEILNIDEDTFKKFYEFISMSSMRNIFEEKNQINYKNYNDIIYNYDFIEEELGKLILPGIKKFKADKIKFITYLFEGFRGGNSTILVDFNAKYIQRELTQDEKESLNELLKENNNSKFYNDVFASLQIIMNEVIKENYDQTHLIYRIIEKLPNYIILNEKLVKLLKIKHDYNPEDKSFTINSLVSIFEYFEALCWKEIRKNILIDYKLELSEEVKKKVIDYFNQKNEGRIINKKNFTTALRRLISRSIAGSRQEIDIKSDSELKLYINRDDLWSKEIIENELFDVEIDQICVDEIKIGHSFNLFNILDGDSILSDEINKDKNKEKKRQREIINENIIENTAEENNQNVNDENKELKEGNKNEKDEEQNENEEEEEEEEEERDDNAL